ncbi:MAG: FixH family protein [Chitinophagales bacterium]|nr:FixH family protein [Chitinophagales bacterium]MDW8274470.1 FixH family protein [Chitinophagales bacterium]
MVKRIHWGWGIAIAYSAFALSILFMVFLSTRHKTELVTPNYYEEELKYQERINRIENTRKLKEPLKWEIEGKQVKLIFPKELSGRPSAKILFYKPNNSALDFTISCTADDNGLCFMDAGRLTSGIYHMQIEWQSGQTEYYNEAVINIQ